MERKSSHGVLWVSILRIFATILIFVFHFLGLFNLPTWHLDTVAISIFCFITGYLLFPIRASVLQWFKKKYFQLMIPYWLVVIVVIFVNYIVKYKQKSITELVTLFFMGGLFQENALYVVSWYITFMICIYFLVSIVFFFENIYIRAILFVVSLFLYHYVINKGLIYLFSLLFGCQLQKYYSKQKALVAFHSRFNDFLYFIQERCYSFFLIHGGILLMFHNLAHLQPLSCFVASFCTTLVIAHFHYNFCAFLTHKFLSNSKPA